MEEQKTLRGLRYEERDIIDGQLKKILYKSIEEERL